MALDFNNPVGRNFVGFGQAQSGATAYPYDPSQADPGASLVGGAAGIGTQQTPNTGASGGGGLMNFFAAMGNPIAQYMQQQQQNQLRSSIYNQYLGPGLGSNLMLSPQAGAGLAQQGPTPAQFISDMAQRSIDAGNEMIRQGLYSEGLQLRREGAQMLYNQFNDERRMAWDQYKFGTERGTLSAYQQVQAEQARENFALSQAQFGQTLTSFDRKKDVEDRNFKVGRIDKFNQESRIESTAMRIDEAIQERLAAVGGDPAKLRGTDQIALFTRMRREITNEMINEADVVLQGQAGDMWDRAQIYIKAIEGGTVFGPDVMQQIWGTYSAIMGALRRSYNRKLDDMNSILIGEDMDPYIPQPFRQPTEAQQTSGALPPGFQILE